MAHVMIVPGLAVRSYALGPVNALREAGHRVDLLEAPAWRGVPAALDRYGEQLAARIATEGGVDLLIGLSVGTQVAAAAAAVSKAGTLGRLLLVSPTVDPARRSRTALLRAWLGGEDGPGAPSTRQQARDWLRSTPGRLLRAIDSAVTLRLEDVLPRSDIPVTIVHAGADTLSPLSFAVALSLPTQSASRVELVELTVMPDAPHSWPVADHDRFVRFIDRLLIG